MDVVMKRLSCAVDLIAVRNQLKLSRKFRLTPYCARDSSKINDRLCTIEKSWPSQIKLAGLGQ